MSDSDDDALSQQTPQEMLHDADYEANDVLTALEEVKRPPEETSNKPVAFRCNDGKTYWLKSSDSLTSHARLSELIAGRLGGLTLLAPRAEVQICAAVGIIQRISFSDLIGAVAVRPGLVEWGSTARHRLRIAHALDRRRNELPIKIEEWMKR